MLESESYTFFKKWQSISDSAQANSSQGRDGPVCVQDEGRVHTLHPETCLERRRRRTEKTSFTCSSTAPCKGSTPSTRCIFWVYKGAVGGLGRIVVGGEGDLG